MKHLLSILLTAILCATASAQTIKPLSYNASNNAVIAATNTNALAFNNNIRVFDTLIQDAEISWSGVGIINFEERRFRGGGWTFDEAPGFDDVAGTRASLGIGLNDAPEIKGITVIGTNTTAGIRLLSNSIISFDRETPPTQGTFTNTMMTFGGNGGGVTFNVPLGFTTNANVASTRTNLGLGGGITTNITFVDASTNTNSVTISNGIITGWTQ